MNATLLSRDGEREEVELPADSVRHVKVASRGDRSYVEDTTPDDPARTDVPPTVVLSAGKVYCFYRTVVEHRGNPAVAEYVETTPAVF